MSIFLGHERDTGKRFYLPTQALRTHLGLMASTGKGKTTALEAIIHQLVTSEKAAFFIIDRMGSFTFSLLLWFASRFCPQRVRDRLIYINPAREDLVMPFNPLRYSTLGEGYFRAMKACECILRAWDSQDMGQMPRLSRWMQGGIWSVAQLGLTIADCFHLFMPTSPYREAIIRLLPSRLQAQWAEIDTPRGFEKVESTQNRMQPWVECPQLYNMFGSTDSRLDTHRFMRDRNIVLVNLAPQNRFPTQAADAVGGLLLYDIFSTARSLPFGVKYPTYVILDEFQRFVSQDMADAIPEVRQLGIRLILSHQSRSQLDRGDVDLTSLMSQLQSQIILGLQGEDADYHAQELAARNHDSYRVKEDIYVRRQLLKGHEIINLRSWSQSESEARNWSNTVGSNWSASSGSSQSTGSNNSTSSSISRQFIAPMRDSTRTIGSTNGQSSSNTETQSTGNGGTESSGEGGSASQSFSESVGESLLPIHEEFKELSRRTYFSPEEQRAELGKEIRLLKTGQAIITLVDDPKIYRVDIERHTPGHLEWNVERIIRKLPAAIDAVHALIEQSANSGLFVSPALIEQETHERLQRVLNPVIRIPGNVIQQENPLA